jgi:UDP-glucose 4-epimerase
MEHRQPIPNLSESFSGTRVLITGGLGFIGSNLARALVAAGADVVLVDSLAPMYGGNHFNVAGLEDSLRIEIADIRDSEVVRRLIADREVVFNLSGQTSHVDSIKDPFVDLEMNCRAQISVLEACRRENPGVKIVFASTRQIYGRPHYLPVDESHPIEPIDVNGVHKAAGEWYHVLYSRIHGLRVSILRLTNTYGPRMRVKDDRQTFLGSWLRIVLQSDELPIFGDGRQIRDFTYIDDAVRAFLTLAAGDDWDGTAYNLGGERPVSLLELAEILIRIAGRGSYRMVPFPDERVAIDIGDYYSDFAKARARLGWSPSVPIEEGLSRSLAFFEKHAQHYW